MKTREHIGVIGLGLLGSALAERALAAGFDVAGFDPDEKCRRRLRKLGGRPLSSARAVAQDCPRLVLALPHDGVSRQVLDDLQPVLTPGTFIFDATTGDADAMAGLGRQLARRRVRYLDTTILGSSELVRAGGSLVMVGGTLGDVRRSRGLLRCFGKEVFHLGPCGSGARMKLVVNLVLGLNRAALAEGLAFARATGVSPERALQVLRAGLAYSRIMDTKGEKMLRRDFKPVARLAQHLKDVRLILNAARRAGLGTPLSRQHARLLAKVAASGGGELDNSAVILAYD